MGTVGISFSKGFAKTYGKIRNIKERDKADKALAAFQKEGSSAAHFKYLSEIDKKLKAKGLVLGRLTPLAAGEDKKDAFYTALDIQPHENCYRDWKRDYSQFLP